MPGKDGVTPPFSFTTKSVVKALESRKEQLDVRNSRAQSFLAPDVTDIEASVRSAFEAMMAALGGVVQHFVTFPGSFAQSAAEQ